MIDRVKRSLRILYVDTENFWRGGQEQLYSLMVGIRQRGYGVELAAPVRSPLASRAREAGIPIHRFTQRSELSLQAFWRLAWILSPRKVDLLHFNTPRPVLAGKLAALIAGVPILVASRRVNFPLRTRFSRIKYNWLLDRVVTVSGSIKRTLVHDGVQPERVSVIYEGVDLESVDGLPPTSVLPVRSGLVVGVVAHLSPEKGHLTVLKAAARLREKFPDVTYVFVGGGERRPVLEEHARALNVADRVLFTGFRNDSDAMMREFDVFCLASLSEGLSSAILAAMARQLPVVATRVGGIPELVVDGSTGLLVPAGRPDLLAEALAKVLSSSSLRRRMREAGRRRVAEYFTLDRKLDETERLYLELVEIDRAETSGSAVRGQGPP